VLALRAAGLGAETSALADTALHIAQARGAGELQAYRPHAHRRAPGLDLRAALARAVRAQTLELATSRSSTSRAATRRASSAAALDARRRACRLEFIPLAEATA
jgi:hypothetical protein